MIVLTSVSICPLTNIIAFEHQNFWVKVEAAVVLEVEPSPSFKEFCSCVDGDDASADQGDGPALASLLYKYS